MFHFIDTIADYIIENYSDKLSELKVLFPNRRAALFLEKRLSEKLDVTYINPQFYSIDMLVNEHVNLIVPERISLIHMLYETFVNIHETDERFPHFYSYGDKLLADFDLMDKYMVDTEKLFQTIREIDEIDEQFDFLSEEAKELIIQFWTKINKYKEKGEHWKKSWSDIGVLYNNYTSRLKENDYAYSGMKYRILGERTALLDDWKDAPVIIAGFNRLSTSEYQILKALNHADFFWDVDQYYMKDHIGGRFVKGNIEEFGNKCPQSNFIGETEKNVTVVDIPKSNTQAQVAVDFIEDKGWNPGKTMILLADDSQLLPMLTHIPDSITRLNVSMGWAIKESPISNLINQILELQLNYDRQSHSYPSISVRNLLSNPYLTDFARDIKLEFKSEYSEVSKLLDSDAMIDAVFKPLEENMEIFDRLLYIVEGLYQNEKQQRTEVDGEEDAEELVGSGVFLLEVLQFIHQKLIRLRDIFEPIAQEQLVDLRELMYLFRQVFNSERIPFRGEPLSGMQILGPLESRSLDYDHVIIFNMKEGSWPPSFSEGIIPQSLRMAYGMPTTEDEVAEYAYYFWSIFSKTKDVLLFDPADTATYDAKVPSRFLVELDSIKENFNYSRISLSQKINLNTPSPIIIEKTPEIMEKLEAYRQHGFSASSLLDFNSCSLKFYLKKILGLEESKQFTPGFDVAKFGTVFHDIMEELYKPYRNEMITDEIINLLLEALPERIDKEYCDAYSLTLEYAQKGEHIIYRKVLLSYGKNVLEFDRLKTPFEMVEVEYDFKKIEKYHTLDDGSKIKILGKIDRLDKKDGKFYALDYKTGSTTTNYTFGDDPFSEKNINKLRYPIQAAFYAFMFDKENTIPQLYGVKSIAKFKEFSDANTTFKINYKAISDEERNTLINEFLEISIANLYDETIPFTQTEELNNCKYCPFVYLCSRENKIEKY